MSEPFLTDIQQLKSGLILFRRSDVQHKNWYCRIKVPNTSRYKTVSLKTENIREATDKAFDLDGEVRFKVKHQVPVFDKSFTEVALEFSALQKRVADIGQITQQRWKTVDGHIRLHLIPYMKNAQITSVTESHWTEYPFWRKENNAPKKSQKKHPLHKKPKVSEKAEEEEHKAAKNGSIRQEMVTLRAILIYAASKHHIRESQVPKGDMPEDKNRREAFTPQEWRKLHTFAREDWMKQGDKKLNIWYRNMAYNFMLIMGNSGMRNSEARSLRWRDIDVRKTKDGRAFVVMNVRGKGKHRELIAASNVVTYLDRIKELFIEAHKLRLKPSEHKQDLGPKPDDSVFSTYQGKGAISLYDTLIYDLLEKSGLAFGNTEVRRSIYSFRHTYATFRLMEGIDVYFLAKQMGTSVKMIEDYYGHIAPAKNAERILAGIPGWEPLAEESGGKDASVNAATAGKDDKKPRKK
ncbi:MAG: site-specific integrase [Micavibrio sp.]|nr:site-specific integrase [Micavibrio sp.]